MEKINTVRLFVAVVAIGICSLGEGVGAASRCPWKYQKQIHSEMVFLEPEDGERVVEHELVFNQTGKEAKIIRSWALTGYDQGLGYVRLVSGGENHPNMTLHFQSHPGDGISYKVQIYACIYGDR
ncbi:uncharacterized protein LOC117588437 [Drosophila guanche]|uniref:uncharacterized protein LOC117588437 n=1 Tax=Drosophila guanche TaxID=7266 RepID=UPI001470B98D|nr:uncharacterized protein LOC117588437 [Drosophila guanche]